MRHGRRDFLKQLVASLAVVYAQDALSDPGAGAKVLLKLDDFVFRPGNAGMSQGWKKVLDFISSQNIKASLGVIGNNLQKGGEQQFRQQGLGLAASGNFEFWNHGYAKRNNTGSFADDEEEQFSRLSEIQDKLAEIVGYEPRFFGPHSANHNLATFQALARIKAIKGIWFYAPPSELAERFFIIPRNNEAERPLSHPNTKLAINGIKTSALNSLQFHPDQWDNERFRTFCDIVHMLIDEGAQFLLPSDLLKDV